MKIDMKILPTVTIEEFAEKYDLTMTVNERGHLKETDPARFYASFNGIEIKGDGVLIGGSGSGRTPVEAIRAYVECIHRKPLVKDAYRPTRMEIPPHNIVSGGECRGGER